jgi:hypothetical protein
MPADPRASDARPRIADAAGAERLVAEALETVAALEAALAEETALVRVGRLRDGLASAERKAELAARYHTGTETLKANAVALSRLAPNGVAKLREAHARLAASVAANQAVLATARAVSEGVVKALSAELARGGRPQTYGATPTRSPYGTQRAEPLVVSRIL